MPNTITVNASEAKQLYRDLKLRVTQANINSHPASSLTERERSMAIGKRDAYEWMFDQLTDLFGIKFLEGKK